MKKRRKPLILLGFPAKFLASRRGFEPPAYRLGGGRSIQLSYGNILQSLLYHSFAILSNVYLTKKLTRHSNKFGSKYKSKAEIAGGIILVLIGLKIFLEEVGIPK